MSEPPVTDPQTQQTGGASAPLIVSDELRTQFPDLVDLIEHSESMNDEERQYWMNILPIMTAEQIGNLREILTTERTQLAAIDAQYAKTIDAVGQEEFLKQVSEERQKRQSERTQAESSAKETEDKKAEDLLKHIEGSA